MAEGSSVDSADISMENNHDNKLSSNVGLNITSEILAEDSEHETSWIGSLDDSIGLRAARALKIGSVKELLQPSYSETFKSGAESLIGVMLSALTTDMRSAACSVSPSASRCSSRQSLQRNSSMNSIASQKTSSLDRSNLTSTPRYDVSPLEGVSKGGKSMCRLDTIEQLYQMELIPDTNEDSVLSEPELQAVFGSGQKQNTMDLLSAAGKLQERRNAHGGYGTPSSYASENEMNMYFDNQHDVSASSSGTEATPTKGFGSGNSTDTGVDSELSENVDCAENAGIQLISSTPMQTKEQYQGNGNSHNMLMLLQAANKCERSVAHLELFASMTDSTLNRHASGIRKTPVFSQRRNSFESPLTRNHHQREDLGSTGRLKRMLKTASTNMIDEDISKAVLLNLTTPGRTSVKRNVRHGESLEKFTAFQDCLHELLADESSPVKRKPRDILNRSQSLEDCSDLPAHNGTISDMWKSCPVLQSNVEISEVVSNRAVYNAEVNGNNSEVGESLFPGVSSPPTLTEITEPETTQSPFLIGNMDVGETCCDSEDTQSAGSPGCASRNAEDILRNQRTNDVFQQNEDVLEEQNYCPSKGSSPTNIAGYSENVCQESGLTVSDTHKNVEAVDEERSEFCCHQVFTAEEYCESETESGYSTTTFSELRPSKASLRKKEFADAEPTKVVFVHEEISPTEHEVITEGTDQWSDQKDAELPQDMFNECCDRFNEVVEPPEPFSHFAMKENDRVLPAADDDESEGEGARLLPNQSNIDSNHLKAQRHNDDFKERSIRDEDSHSDPFPTQPTHGFSPSKKLTPIVALTPLLQTTDDITENFAKTENIDVASRKTTTSHQPNETKRIYSNTARTPHDINPQDNFNTPTSVTQTKAAPPAAPRKNSLSFRFENRYKDLDRKIEGILNSVTSPAKHVGTSGLWSQEGKVAKHVSVCDNTSVSHSTSKTGNGGQGTRRNIFSEVTPTEAKIELERGKFTIDVDELVDDTAVKMGEKFLSSVSPEMPRAHSQVSGKCFEDDAVRSVTKALQSIKLNLERERENAEKLQENVTKSRQRIDELDESITEDSEDNTMSSSSGVNNKGGSKVRTLEEVVILLKKHVQQRELEIDVLGKQLNESNSRIKKLEKRLNDKSLDEYRMKGLQQDKDDLYKRLNGLLTDREQLEEKIGKITRQKEDAEIATRKAKEDLQLEIDRRHILSKSANLYPENNRLHAHELKERVDDLEVLNKSSASDLERTERELESLKRENRSLRMSNEHELVELKADHGNMREKLDRMHEISAENLLLHTDVADYQKELSELRDEARVLRSKCYDLSEENRQCKAEIRDLRRYLDLMRANKGGDTRQDLLNKIEYYQMEHDRLLDEVRHLKQRLGDVSPRSPRMRSSSPKVGSRHTHSSPSKQSVRFSDSLERGRSPVTDAMAASNASSYAATRVRKDRSLSPSAALNVRDLTMDRYGRHMEGPETRQYDCVDGHESPHSDDSECTEMLLKPQPQINGRPAPPPCGIDSDDDDVELHISSLRNGKGSSSSSSTQIGLRSGSNDRLGTSPHRRSRSPGSPVGFRCISPRLTSSQKCVNDSARDRYPTQMKRSLPRRAFAPRNPSDIKLGYCIKFTRPGGKLSRGTVRYIGHLPTRNEIFVGVELDGHDGKHSGTHQGTKYFTCPPNKGVFTPFSKVIMAWE